MGFTMSGVPIRSTSPSSTPTAAANSTPAMKPCPEKAETECPVYRADGPFVYALETKKGKLPSGGITACMPS